MNTFQLPARKLNRLSQTPVASDVLITIVVEAAEGSFYNLEISFYEGNAFIEKAYVFIAIPVIINEDSFLSMWLNLLLDRSNENSNKRFNLKRLAYGGRVITPRNLGYPSIILVSKDLSHEWCFTSEHLTWPQRVDGKLPIIRKNGVRIVETSWYPRDNWPNFGIVQDQICIELWNHEQHALARYFCPFTDILSRSQVINLHLDVPVGTEVFNLLDTNWDEREKFRLKVKVFGPLLIMTSMDGELKALASAQSFMPKAFHVIKIIHDQLVQVNARQDGQALIELFQQRVSNILFSANTSEHEVEQQLITLCFNVVDRLTQE